MAECHPEEKTVLKTSLGEFRLAETVEYSESARSRVYVLGQTAIILDDNVWSRTDSEIFPYSLITGRQNEYMHRYEKVFRFLEEDKSQIEFYLNGGLADAEAGFPDLVRQANRQNLADASPLELYFEDHFSQVYGRQSIRFLQKEYGITDRKGSTKYFDYYLCTRNGQFAVEENGVHYHHPQIIGKERYRAQLEKQNACMVQDIKVFRFSSEDCRFADRFEDDIKTYFGENASGFVELGQKVSRPFQLYPHQEHLLEAMEEARSAGTAGFLVVLPTAAGKSRVVEEDLLGCHAARPDLKVLILVPTTQIKTDWEKRIESSLQPLKDRIDLCSYNWMQRHYRDIDPEFYDYIVVDEAHHAVAAEMKRMIQHFNPGFLLGLTATDQRPDHKKLEEVFGSYRTHLSLKEAMDQKIIASCSAFRIETNIDLSQVRINGKDYRNADLENTIRVTSRNELIADVLKEYFCEGSMAEKQGVVFCVNVRHAREMEKVLNRSGISARALVSKSGNPDQIMEDFRNKKIRFLCSCQMISEGWDYPDLGILVMARPTLSKVLYLQQLGRGLRKTKTKNNVFVIDVVDSYGSMIRPFTLHAVFHNPQYVPFGDPNRHYQAGDWIEVDGLKERVERIEQVDVESFEDLYGDYLSQEQLAREFFVSTGTITSWIKKKKLVPTVTFRFGARRIPMFSPEDVEASRKELGIEEHNDETIKKDFFDFLEERDYSLSYKMPFVLSFLNHLDDSGEARIDEVLKDYTSFYQDRIDRSLPVDRSICPYSAKTLQDKSFMKRSMLANPFEKFERKRFFYYSKDLNLIAMNRALFNKMTPEDFQTVKEQMIQDLKNYYDKLEKQTGSLN